MPVTNFGFDFRATAGYVADPNYAAPVLGETYPHTYTNALGDSVVAGVSVPPVDTRDRINTGDVRLAGINFNANGNAGSPSFFTYRVDLPFAGSWSLIGAFGDGQNPQSLYIKILDDVTVLATFAAVATPGGYYFMDASGNVYFGDVFFASQTPLVHTFVSTKLNIQVGPTSPTGSALSAIAYLQITGTPPAPPSGTINILRGSHIGSRITPPYNPG